MKNGLSADEIEQAEVQAALVGSAPSQVMSEPARKPKRRRDSLEITTVCFSPLILMFEAD